ncbi:TetR/AcrR family transcriptional regulator [Clostridium sp. 'White wine YQ']|uniref:TetR/AcrR family transcriptional regulator n=1 Tax=Clostridium sp. 'White wine YQ' TaxID=3027474 RepID=UPI002366FDDF|nr:TetR/AcrR family transcriptional regulator [Clostridium sp. 'White wine YQ']MDD7795550.1 TetR/AcrR family transcriptional regulator [Clostridium sp. 'White wine YQ']
MNSIFTKFLSLKPEKQERILNAAIKEFARKGYKNTATDEITKEANISKGALFHYFNSKKDLFLFLYDHALEILMNEFFGKIDLNEKDILKRLRQVLLVEFMLVNKYPDMLDFVKVANFEDADEVKDDMESRNKEYFINAYSKVLNNFDTSKFKENIDIRRAVDVIIWTMEGFTAKEKEKIKTNPITNLNFDEILSEMDIYFDLLKDSFYK